MVLKLSLMQLLGTFENLLSITYLFTHGYIYFLCFFCALLSSLTLGIMIEVQITLKSYNTRHVDRRDGTVSAEETLFRQEALFWLTVL